MIATYHCWPRHDRRSIAVIEAASREDAAAEFSRRFGTDLVMVAPEHEDEAVLFVKGEDFE